MQAYVYMYEYMIFLKINDIKEDHTGENRFTSLFHLFYIKMAPRYLLGLRAEFKRRATNARHTMT